MHELASSEGFIVGGLPEGITALQRLQHLRLDKCVTAAPTHSISRLTQLTCLEVTQDELHHYEIWTAYELVVR